MNYCEIKENDIANGPGVRVSLFVSGCERHCTGCFQPETWDFDYGEPFTTETIQRLIKALDRKEIEGLTILGGEPLHPRNVETVSQLVGYFKMWTSVKSIWIYTGYLFEELLDRTDISKVLMFTDVIVDGAFVEELKNITLEFRGSENQRIIDVKKTLASGELILWENPQKGRP